MKRNKDNQYGYSAWSMEEVMRFARFFLLPLLVVILIAVILIMDKRKEPQSQNQDTVEESTDLTAEESSLPAESFPEPAAQLFTANSVPQVNELIQRYFTAKENSDAATIYQLFGWTEEIGQDGLQRQLQYDARYTEGYRNIVCYTAPGEIDGTYLVCVSYDLKVKNSLTLAPGFQWSYVRTGTDGNLYLTVEDELSEPEKAFVQEALKADEIVLLRVEIYAKLRAALESDPALAESYGILEKKGGSAGAKQTEQHEANVQIDGVTDPVGENHGNEEGSESGGAEIHIEGSASGEAESAGTAVPESESGGSTVALPGSPQDGAAGTVLPDEAGAELSGNDALGAGAELPEAAEAGVNLPEDGAAGE